ncbi:hypothetical protein [Pseudomonas syringae]|uniref:hypothetical protein n=1 Tax=Pseudomonas syringae TaxID=317 RepID=UPI00042508D3|nr:hypothetical protein [Pseudomonas syringae]
MSKHPIPDWLRSQFSRIEDEVQKLGPCGVFTQMRTVTQTYFEQQAEAAQPPALGGEHETFQEWWDSLAIKWSDPSAKTAAWQGFNIGQAKLAPLQAEIEHLRAGGALIVQHMNDYKKERDQLKAEAEQLSETSMSQEAMIEQLMALCDEQAKALHTLISVARTVNRNDASEIRVPGDDEPQYRQRKEWIEYLLETCAEAEALSKPAGSEQA